MFKYHTRKCIEDFSICGPGRWGELPCFCRMEFIQVIIAVIKKGSGCTACQGLEWLIGAVLQWNFQQKFPPGRLRLPGVCCTSPVTFPGGISPPVPMETAPGLLNSSENHFNLEPSLWGIGIVDRNEKQFWDRITFVSYLQQN